MPQDPALFHRSIAENIAYGRPGATPDEIALAARRARAHDFIAALPKGYDTLVGERGVKLSGGERQRVAIARAVVGEHQLLLADEPSGALDSVSGETVMRMIHAACKRGLAAVVVTHDAQLASWADRVVFLRDGRVTDQTAPPPGPESLLSQGQSQ